VYCSKNRLDPTFESAPDFHLVSKLPIHQYRLVIPLTLNVVIFDLKMEWLEFTLDFAI